MEQIKKIKLNGKEYSLEDRELSERVENAKKDISANERAILKIYKYTKIMPTLSSGVTGSVTCRYNPSAVHISGNIKLGADLSAGKDLTICTVNIPSSFKPVEQAQTSLGYYQFVPYVIKLETSGVLKIRILINNVTIPSGTSLGIRLSYFVEYSEDYIHEFTVKTFGTFSAYSDETWDDYIERHKSTHFTTFAHGSTSCVAYKREDGVLCRLKTSLGYVSSSGVISKYSSFDWEIV